MILLVADASAIGEYVLGTGLGEHVSSMLVSGEYDVHVPHLCDGEVLSAIRRFLLQGHLNRERALDALEDYSHLPITRHRHVELMPRALGLRFNFAAADALYIALAEILDATLLTADRALARSTSAHTRVPVLEV